VIHLFLYHPSTLVSFPLTCHFQWFASLRYYSLLLDALLWWTELSALNSSELFTPCENLHFYKLFICLFTLLPPLPVLFFQLFLWPFCDFSPTLFYSFSTSPSFISLFIFWLEYGGSPKRSRGLNGGHREWICIICGVALVHRHRERRCQPVQGELNSPRQLRD